MESQFLKKVLVVDDHPVVRNAVIEIIRQVLGPCKIVEMGSLAQLSLLDGAVFDLVLTDLSLPDADGIDTVVSLKERGLDRIMVFSVHDERRMGKRCIRAGAMAYVMKDSPPEDLRIAIRAVAEGKSWLSDALGGSVQEKVAADPVDQLTYREFQVFQGLGNGRSTQALARDLNLSPKTVETHRDRIRKKLDCPSSVDLMLRARDWINDSSRASSMTKVLA